MICTFLSRRAGASAMPGASPSFSGGAVRRRSTAVSIVFFLLVWVATGAAAQSPVVTAPPIPELTLPDALRIAVDGNPGLAELRERALTAAEVPSQAGTLPDPKLNFNALNLPVDTFSHSQEAMTQMQFGVSQSFPFPGTLHLRREAATYAAQAASLSVDEARLRLLRDVKKA